MIWVLHRVLAIQFTPTVAEMISYLRTWMWNPFVMARVAYFHEMDDGEHRELAEVLRAVRGRVAISVYDSPLYRELYPAWNRHEDHFRRKNSGKGIAQEILWTNY